MMQMEVVALGTAQDGGIPQAGCSCANCRRARRSRRLARTAASLGLIDQQAGLAFLVDATPDLPEQLGRLGGGARAGASLGASPGAGLGGVLLTHAHIGHYTGLMHFGREVMGLRGMPVWCTTAVATFLSGNAPWSQLVRLGNIELRPEVDVGPAAAARLGRPITLTPSLSVAAFQVPHRDEFADTVGFRIHGPSRSILYIPDIDRWETWDRDVAAEVAGVDLAVLDGTFFSAEELLARGRDPREVPHPPIVETMDRLQGVVDHGAQVFFTHLNHTNPVLRASSPQRRQVEERGFHILEEGLTLRL